MRASWRRPKISHQTASVTVKVTQSATNKILIRSRCCFITDRLAAGYCPPVRFHSPFSGGLLPACALDFKLAASKQNHFLYAPLPPHPDLLHSLVQALRPNGDRKS